MRSGGSAMLRRTVGLVLLIDIRISTLSCDLRGGYVAAWVEKEVKFDLLLEMIGRSGGRRHGYGRSAKISSRWR